MKRAKLGLALAGGGFRASLFHLGVLRRMAELDLLRYVEVLSTVSGGSIVGALYVLLLKQKLENQDASLGPEKLRISQHEYEAIVDELQAALVGGIRNNLRTRLFMNPMALLKAMLLENSLASEMGNLYEKYIFKRAGAKLRALDSKNESPKGRIPLRAICLRKDEVRRGGGTEHYNAMAVDSSWDKSRGGPGSAVTRLIINATSLNSGARFWFSHTEVGDWYLGHFRYDEVETELLRRKVLMDLPPKKRQELLDAWPANPKACWEKMAGEVVRAWGVHRTKTSIVPPECPKQQTEVRLVDWSAGRDERERAASPLPLPWDGPIDTQAFRAFVERLLSVDAGRLRDAKNRAWYLAVGRHRDPQVDGGLEASTLWMLFWDSLKTIDPACATQLEKAKSEQLQEPKWCNELFDWIMEVYYLRTANAMSPHIQAEWDALPLADAVAASAAFPPVFPPYPLYDFYDDANVQVLSLTDGGAFDNIGVTALLDEHCNYIVASDTGEIFDNQQSKSAVGRVGMTWRLLSMLMNRPAQLYRHDLNERRRLSNACAATAAPIASEEFSAVSEYAAGRELKGLASFQIGSARPAADSARAIDPKLISRIRTDLDVFGSIEIECLLNEGYLTADQQIRRELHGSPFDPAVRTNGVEGWKPISSVPFPMDLTEPGVKKRVERILAVGKHRFFRALMLNAPLSTSITILTVGMLVGAVWVNDVDWTQIQSTTSKGLAWVVTQMFTWDVLVEWIQRIELKYVAAVALSLLIVWLAVAPAFATRAPHVARGARREHAVLFRKILTAWKKVKSCKGNLLWLFKLLPLTVFVIAGIAWVSHLVFAIPFQWRTRDLEGLDRQAPRDSGGELRWGMPR